jgi:hypothetical protein
MLVGDRSGLLLVQYKCCLLHVLTSCGGPHSGKGLDRVSQSIGSDGWGAEGSRGGNYNNDICGGAITEGVVMAKEKHGWMQPGITEEA